MTLGELITIVQRQFGDTSEVQLLRTDVISWANQAQIDVAKETECLQDHKETNSVASDGSYTLPEDFLAMRKVKYDNKVIKPTTMEMVDQIFPSRDVSGDTGTPYMYYIWSNMLFLYPAPIASGVANLDIYYIRYPKVLVNDTDPLDLPLSYHEAVEKYALAKAKIMDEEYVDADKIKKDYEEDLAENKYASYNQNRDSYPAVRLISGDDW